MDERGLCALLSPDGEPLTKFIYDEVEVTTSRAASSFGMPTPSSTGSPVASPR